MNARHRPRTTAAAVALVLTAGLVTAAPAFAAAPTITSFTPTSGKLYTPVAITGTGFTAPATVTFDGIATTPVTVVSATRITTRVPAGAATGKITVTTTAGTTTSTGVFTITPGVFINAGAVGPPTATRTVTFSGFGPYEVIDIYLDTTDELLATTDGNGAGTATLTIPANATPGQHWITVQGRHSGYGAQTPLTVRTDWTQFGDGPGHTNANAYENLLNSYNVDELSPAWSTPAHGYLRASPVLVGGVVYVGWSNGTVQAFDETTGAVKWTYSSFGGVESSLAVTGGTVYYGANDGVVHALDAGTGAVKWTYRIGSIAGSATVTGGLVYVGSGNDSVYALNASTGALVWTYATTGAVDETTPAVLGGVAYVGSADHILYALDAATGAVVWTKTLDGPVTTPVVVAGRVYAATGDAVYALRSASGATIWTYAGANTIDPGMGLSNGTLYVGDITGSLDAINAGDGTLRWSAAVGDESPLLACTIENGVVYTSTHTHTYAVNASYGGELATFDDGPYTAAGAVVVDGTLTVSDNLSGITTHYTLDATRTAARPSPSALNPDRDLTVPQSSP